MQDLLKDLEKAKSVYLSQDGQLVAVWLRVLSVVWLRVLSVVSSRVWSEVVLLFLQWNKHK